MTTPTPIRKTLLANARRAIREAARAAGKPRPDAEAIIHLYTLSDEELIETIDSCEDFVQQVYGL